MEQAFIKHSICIGLGFVLLFGAFLIIPAHNVSADSVDGDYIYSVNAGGATITGYIGGGGEITIPSRLGEHNTVAVGDYAFQTTSLTSVTIPNSVISLGEGAFYQCPYLASVTIGSGATTIGGYAFADCNSLISITFYGLVAPTDVGFNWNIGTDAGIKGHAYADSNFPVPGDVFYGLMMGDIIPVVPDVPTGLVATPDNAQVNLTWTAPADGGSVITGYNVYRSISETGPYSLINCSTEPTYTDIGLNNGHTYWYNVSAVNEVGEGMKTAPVSSIPFTVPDPPTELTAIADDRKVTLSWTAPLFNGGSDIDYYTIYQNDVALPDHQTILTIEITGLSNGWSYSFAVAAHNLAGIGTPSNAISSTPRTVPDVPIGLTANRGDSQVVLTWSSPISDGGSAIIGYQIYRGTSSGGEMLRDTIGNLLTYTDANLINGQTYYYKISAVNLAGEGAKSNEVSATPVTVPSPPTIRSATPGNGQVSLVWTAPTSNGGIAIEGYKVYRSTSSGAETPLVTLGSVLTYIDAGLTNGQTYYYKISAVNSIGEGAQSNEISATPATVPSAPILSTATPGNAQVVLIWSAPISDGGSSIINYTVYRSTISGTETLLITLGNVLTYMDTGLMNGQTYYYKISAVNSIGEGAQSNEISATPLTVPTPPRGLQAVAGELAIDLNWTAPSYLGPGSITYHLFRDGVLIWSGMAIAYQDAPLTKGIQCSYKVAAQNQLGWGPNCTAVLATPFGVPDAPWGLTAISGDTKISLSWNAVNYSGPGSLTYHLFRDGVLVWSGIAVAHEEVGLTNGQTYDYGVAASNSVGWSANSSSMSATPKGPPSIPRGLRAEGGNGFVLLNWTAPQYIGPGELKYHLFRNDILVWSGKQLTFNDTQVSNFVSYSYSVAAQNSIGWGENSTEVQAIPLPYEMKPTAPRDLNVNATAGNENMTLTWSEPLNSNASAVTGYMISYGTAPGSMPNHIIWSQRAYVLQGLEKGQVYYFKVAAQNSAGWGPNSTIEAATLVGVPSVPIDLVAKTGDGYIHVNWTGPSYPGPGALLFHLFRNGSLLWTGSLLSYNDTMVVMGTTYSYKVASENEIGWGPNSSAVLVALPPVPPPGKPSDLHVSVDEGQVTLTWSHPSQSGAAAITGYKVYRGTTPGLLTLVATVDGTTFVDTDVKENPRYYYQVSAVSSAGEGPATGEVVAVIIASIPSYLWMVIIGAVGAIVAIGAVLIYLRK